MSRGGVVAVWLVTTLAVPGLGAPARLPLPPAAAVVAAMLTAPALVDYEGTKVLSAIRGDHAETVTVLESYKRLGKLRLEFLSPESVSGRLMVDDGASSWQYEPSYHLVIRGPSFVRPPGSAAQAQDILRGYLVAVLGAEEVIGRQTIVVAMEPRAGGAGRRYWVDQATGAVLRMEERDATGEIVFTSFFTRISFGLNLPSALFRFHLPAGARIISLFLAGDPVDSPAALRRQSGFGTAMPTSLSYGYRFRDGTVSRYGALAASAAMYTDGMRVLTVYQTLSSRMAFPRVGMPVKLEAADARLLDLGYVRLLIWQWRGITYALAGSLSAAALVVIADEITP
jgi:outer membrane lipoprotein-sorting protein